MTDSRMTELLPCANCGGGAEYDTVFNNVCEDWVALVRCVDCYMSVRVEEDTEELALEIAVDNWNSRAGMNAAEAVRTFVSRYERRMGNLERVAQEMARALMMDCGDECFGSGHVCMYFNKSTGDCRLVEKVRELGLEVEL